MGPFPFTSRIGVANKRRIENRLQNIMDGMVNHTVSVRGGADQALLRFTNPEVVILPRLVSLLCQLVMQPPQLSLKIEIKPGSGIFEAFPTLG